MKYALPLIFSLLLIIACNSNTDTSKYENEPKEYASEDDYVEEAAESNSFQYSNSNAATNGNNRATVTFTDAQTSLASNTTTAGSSSGKSAKKKKKSTQKIIYSADMKFQVKNVIESTDAIKAICDKYGAHISKMNLESETYRVSNIIQIRVDESSYNKMIEDFKKSSVHLDELNMKANDVTAEFIDIQSRLKTKIASRDRYIEVLQTKAGTVKEIINAEEAIRRITEEIEAKKGRLRYLKDKVKFSTITLNIYEVIDEPAAVNFVTPYIDKAKDGFGNGWSFIVALSLVMINLWPLILIVSIIVWKRKWLGKKLFGKQ
ncbi:MAG: hypothetical protein ACJAZ2_001309 [Glaciecola sp.]|jgi:hypothetical protein